MEQAPPIKNNEAAKRFELTVGDHTAFVDYILLSKRIIYTHTEVPAALEGQGIGSALARHVLDFARQRAIDGAAAVSLYCGIHEAAPGAIRRPPGPWFSPGLIF